MFNMRTRLGFIAGAVANLLFCFIAQLAILSFVLLFHDISFYYKYMVGTERM